MPDDFSFTPHRNRREPEALEHRIRVIEHALSTLAGRVTSDPLGAGVSVTGSEGGAPVGPPGGGGGSLTAHELLNDAWHVDTVTGTPVSQDLIVANTSNLWERFAVGAEGYVLKVVSGVLAWATAVHNLLSATHGDTVTASVVRGDIVYGDATPRWNRLPKGTSGQVLTTDGTDVFWGTGATSAHNLLSASHGDTVAQTVSRGSLIFGNSTPAWDELTIGASGTVLGSDGTDASWTNIGSLANTSGVLCAWAKDDVSLLSTTGTDANDELFAAWSKGANDRISIVAPVAGQCDYISFTLGGDIGGSGKDLEIELWKNGSATGMKTTLTGGAGTEDEAYTTTGGPITFAAGDNLTLYGKRTGAVNSVKVQAVLWGKFTA